MILTLKILSRNYIALTIWPFIFVKTTLHKLDETLINHEKIHLKQQIEMGWLPFFVWYFIEFLFRLIQYKRWNLAYRNISFEREAYQNETDLNYPKTRNFWGFWRYIKSPK